MKKTSIRTKYRRGTGVKTYVFRVELESDKEGWRAFYPPMEDIGASTWGRTEKEALKNIQEVLSMIVEESVEEGRPIPAEDQVTVSEGALVAVNAV